jgi:hypothetical protein
MSKVIQLSAIKNEGRFGNKLLHYIVGKCYAESIGATVEIPHGWIGETIFEINEPHYEQRNGDTLPPFFNLPHRLVDPCLNRDTVKRLLKWKPEWLRVTAKKESVLHVRRGDYLTLPDFPVVPEKDLRVATHWWERFSGPPVVVSEDNPFNNELFSNPLSFLEDFQTLMMAKNIFVYPRSTFSQLAALLGDGNIYMPYDYGVGPTTCKFKLVDPSQPVIFPTKNNSLP